MDLTKPQRDAAAYALHGHNMAILGQSGTGKTSLVKIIKEKLNRANKIVAMTATTGIAALNVNGKTIHRGLV